MCVFNGEQMLLKNYHVYVYVWRESWRYGSPVSRVVNHVGPVHIVDAEKDTVADDI